MTIDLSAPVRAAIDVTAEVGGDGFNGPSPFTSRVEDDHVTRMTIRA
jgi:hypothetical protein